MAPTAGDPGIKTSAPLPKPDVPTSSSARPLEFIITAIQPPLWGHDMTVDGKKWIIFNSTREEREVYKKRITWAMGFKSRWVWEFDNVLANISLTRRAPPDAILIDRCGVPLDPNNSQPLIKPRAAQEYTKRRGTTIPASYSPSQVTGVYLYGGDFYQTRGRFVKFEFFFEVWHDKDGKGVAHDSMRLQRLLKKLEPREGMVPLFYRELPIGRRYLDTGSFPMAEVPRWMPKEEMTKLYESTKVPPRKSATQAIVIDLESRQGRTGAGLITQPISADQAATKAAVEKAKERARRNHGDPHHLPYLKALLRHLDTIAQQGLKPFLNHVTKSIDCAHTAWSDGAAPELFIVSKIDRLAFIALDLKGELPNTSLEKLKAMHILGLFEVEGEFQSDTHLRAIVHSNKESCLRDASETAKHIRELQTTMTKYSQSQGDVKHLLRTVFGDVDAGTGGLFSGLSARVATAEQERAESKQQIAALERKVAELSAAMEASKSRSNVTGGPIQLDPTATGSKRRLSSQDVSEELQPVLKCLRSEPMPKFSEVMNHQNLEKPANGN